MRCRSVRCAGTASLAALRKVRSSRRVGDVRGPRRFLEPPQLNVSRNYQKRRSLSVLGSGSVALDDKVVEGHRHGSISVEGNMCGLVNCEVVAWTLTDNVEPVDKRHISLPILERRRHARRSNPSPGIPKTSCLAGAANTLRLKMHQTTDVVAVHRERNQRV
jgi:hypothetical protein